MKDDIEKAQAWLDAVERQGNLTQEDAVYGLSLCILLIKNVKEDLDRIDMQLQQRTGRF